MSSGAEKNRGNKGEGHQRHPFLKDLLLCLALASTGCAGTVPDKPTTPEAFDHTSEAQMVLMQNGLSTGIQADGTRINNIQTITGGLIDLIGQEEVLRAQGKDVRRFQLPSGGYILVVVEKEEIKPAKSVHKEHSQRLESLKRVVHTWHPAYTENLPEVVAFLHGFNGNLSIDAYWDEIYKLQEQFQRSGVPALFIAPQVRRNSSDHQKYWRGDLKSLIDLARSGSGADLSPNYKTTVIAHSSGYLEIDKILAKKGNKKPNKIILFDCTPVSKKSIDRLSRWLAEPDNELIVVSTSRRSKIHARILNKLGQKVIFYDQTPQAINRTKITHIETKDSHHSMPRLLTESVLKLTHQKPL